MHSAQRALEAAVKSDTALAKLLQELVFRYSAINNVKDPGSLTRALHNCCRLKAKFDEKARANLDAVDELVGKASSASWAPQRFDSILSAVKKIVLNLDSVLELLLETASFQNCQKEWAIKLLAVPCPQADVPTCVREPFPAMAAGVYGSKCQGFGPADGVVEYLLPLRSSVRQGPGQGLLADGLHR